MSSLTLTVEDLEDSLEELDEKIRSFAELECRPTEISVEDHFAVVPLQNLLDHTTRRI